MRIKGQEKVEPIEVKRCFVASDMGKSLANKSREDYIQGTEEIIQKVLGMTEENLNKQISSRDPKRLGLYNKLTWYYGRVSIDDMGVWDEAKGLPHEWCLGSVRETSRSYRIAIEEGKTFPFSDFYRQIPAIKEVADVIEKARFFSIIVVSGETSRGRQNCRKTKWNIDDGCMRAIALTLTGKEELNAYMGRKID